MYVPWEGQSLWPPVTMDGDPILGAVQTPCLSPAAGWGRHPVRAPVGFPLPTTPPPACGNHICTRGVFVCAPMLA